MDAANRNRSGFVFTGWHMWGVMVLFFGTIITVNLIMAWNAVSSWSGLVVQNTFVASQEFNAKAAEARALHLTGIDGTLAIEGEAITYRLKEADGRPVSAETVTLLFKRPVGEAQDFRVDLAPAGSDLFTGTHPVKAGQWIVDISSKRDGKLIFHEAIRVVVRGSQQ